MSKKKIINDPVYGFITIDHPLIFKLLQHPYFQRLARIKQLGLTHLVYPGAQHTRFSHALGAMHLMRTGLEALRSKGHKISKKERIASMAAILLHDIGHGPFSHALEFSIMQGVHHEELSLLIMEKLNEEFDGELSLAIKIFTDNYKKGYLHQMVSSQLDMDRMDYLQRDCFFTGVIEGSIGTDRIIRMLDVMNDQIVVEEKGIYSIENFLNSRRLMYWQVYLHKTSIAAEQMLIQLIRRARNLVSQGVEVPSSPSMSLFLKEKVTIRNFNTDPRYIQAFIALDDYDIWSCIKQWQHHDDVVLSELSHMFMNRQLFKARIAEKPFENEEVDRVREVLKEDKGYTDEQLSYMCVSGEVSNSAYIPYSQNIFIKLKNEKLMDIAEASDLPNIEALSKIVKKYYLCHPKILSL